MQSLKKKVMRKGYWTYTLLQAHTGLCSTVAYLVSSWTSRYCIISNKADIVVWTFWAISWGLRHLPSLWSQGCQLYDQLVASPALFQLTSLLSSWACHWNMIHLDLLISLCGLWRSWEAVICSDFSFRHS